MKRIRKAKGLTLQELADLSGVGRSTIGNIETGRFGGGQESLEPLARALGVTVQELQQPVSAPPPLNYQMPEESPEPSDEEFEAMRQWAQMRPAKLGIHGFILQLRETLRNKTLRFRTRILMANAITHEMEQALISETEPAIAAERHEPPIAPISYSKRKKP